MTPASTGPTLRDTIGRLAPGTALRDGLERILRGQFTDFRRLITQANIKAD